MKMKLYTKSAQTQNNNFLFYLKLNFKLNNNEKNLAEFHKVKFHF